MRLDIEKQVSKVLRSTGMGSVPVSLRTIADKYSVKIRYAPSKEFSGLLLRKNGVAYIGVNNKESELRQRFTIAHELGHLFLHTNDDAFIDHINHRDNSYGVGIKRSRQEIEANAFAAALLIPLKHLVQDFKEMKGDDLEDRDIERLAHKYQVSKEAMTYRILNLGLKIVTS